MKNKLTLLIVAFVIGTPSWIYLFSKDWKIALAILFILWANNIANQINNKE